MIQLLLYCVLTTQGVEYPLCRAERWEPEIQRIEQALAKQPPKPGSIFFVGSSSFRLWDTAAAFGERPTVNVAFGGSRLQDCNYFYDRILKPYTPGRIVLYEGDNDLAAKFTPERILSDYKTFVAKVRAQHPTVPIDFVAVKPSPARWELFAQQTELNEKIRTWSATQAGLGFLDIVPLMLNEEGKPREELFLKDRLHMNAEGYALWQKYFLEKWN